MERERFEMLYGDDPPPRSKVTPMTPEILERVERDRAALEANQRAVSEETP